MKAILKLFLIFVCCFNFNFNAQAQEFKLANDVCTGVGVFTFGARVAADVVSCALTPTNPLLALGCYDLANNLMNAESNIEGHTNTLCFWRATKSKNKNGDIDVTLTIDGAKSEVEKILKAMKETSKSPNSAIIYIKKSD